MNQIVFTLYTDNPTVVKGGKIDNMSNLKETTAYEAWKERGENEGLFLYMSVRDMPIPIIVRSSYCRILIFFQE